MSASRRIGGLSLLAPVFVPAVLGSAGFVAYRTDWKKAIRAFLTGPGRTSRILLLLFVVFNRKNMPLVWTYRVFYSIFYHHFLRQAPALTPRALFKPVITESYSPILEIDYNLHKSNSTYFTDLDVARSHLCSHLCRRGVRQLARNEQSKIVTDPSTGRPMKGAMGIALGSVQCSFQREIPAYKGYEMWNSLLSWDRKWLYIVTYFVPKGAAKPTEWLDPRFLGSKVRGSQDAAGGWDKKMYATAVSKYVFKVGRYTVHPAIVLAESGLLPERPGGWMSGQDQVGENQPDVGDLSDVDLSRDGEWDWRRVEAQRRKGMEVAARFNALDELRGEFNGGNHGAVAKFTSG